MRIYQNCLEMASETERELWEMGVRYQSDTVQDLQVSDDPAYQTMELMFYGYTLTKFEDVRELVEKFGISLEWVDAEFAERVDMRLSNKNPGTAYLKRNALWDTFLHDGVFSYTYAERWQEQLPYIIKELKTRPNTRQAIMTMYDRHQDMMNWGGKSRIPCSLSYHFMIRNGRLNLLYHQRSCDFKKFFAADVAFTLSLLKYVANEVQVEVGSFTHILDSLHVFAEDMPEGVF